MSFYRSAYNKEPEPLLFVIEELENYILQIPSPSDFDQGSSDSTFTPEDSSFNFNCPDEPADYALKEDSLFNFDRERAEKLGCLKKLKRDVVNNINDQTDPPFEPQNENQVNDQTDSPFGPPVGGPS
jgi:hypothetical protein